jgi:putative addiction module killer protein
MGYCYAVYTLRRTRVFEAWFERLRDPIGLARVAIRIRRATFGHFGDHRSLGEGLFEMRLHQGPGYRIYFARREGEIILLLVGGDKSSQSRDIARARELLEIDDGVGQ